MDRSLDESIAERQAAATTEPENATLVEKMSDPRSGIAKLRVENLHYDLTEDDIWVGLLKLRKGCGIYVPQDLFQRIAPVQDAKLRYDRAGRSEGLAFVTYEHVADARAAIREFDGANAKGQPIRLTLVPLPRRDNPFDRVENPKSLFDRIEAPASRSRRRSESPTDDVDEDRGNRRGPRRGGGGGGGGVGSGTRDRRSDTTKPPPENIDRYIPGQRDSRSSSHRGGRRPGERRDRATKDPEGHRLVGGRPRKTAEELDAEMDDYWGGGVNDPATSNNGAPGAQAAVHADVDDVDMIE
ncbi:hypothetical protein H2200_004004 [Cladophialophora chaetospira]|uniref:RRM domain-containing protein n=1 Tax=Cladophialophora chaetospira TaxID=386627 RepID=A0AA38XFE1_9EURO|nr:hypothetical protein H2200_004004 [Cladophialophora chaetospira]